MKLKRDVVKIIIVGLLLLSFLLLVGWKAYLDKKESAIPYEEMRDDSFCMLDFQCEDVAKMELYTETVPLKSTEDLDLIGAMIDALNHMTLFGKGALPSEKTPDEYGGGYTCHISFTMRSGEIYQVAVNEIEHDDGKKGKPYLIFKLLQNGTLKGKYNSEYFGTRYYFQGNVAEVFRKTYAAI